MTTHYPKFNIKRILHVIILGVLILASTSEASGQCPPTVNITSLFSTTVINGNTVAFCSGDSCLLTASPSGGVTHQWFKNGTAISGATSSTYYPTTNGNYHHEVSGCAIPSDIVNVNINPLPNGDITLDVTPPVCAGTDITVGLSALPNLDAYSWGWLPPFGGYPATFIHTFNSTTMIQAFLVDTITYCSRTITELVMVQPSIDPGEIYDDQIICSGSTPAELTGTAPSGGDGTYTYQWQSSIVSATTGFTNIPGATSANYQPGPLTQTTWFRRVVSSNSPCPSATQLVPLEITVDPNPVLTSVTSLAICSGTSVNYSPTSNVAGTTFTWTGTNTSGTVSGISPTGNGSITDILSIPPGGSTSGTATYTITPTGPAPSYCLGTPTNLIVTVLPLPIPGISGPSSACFGSTGNLYTTETGMTNYSWTIQGGVITAGQGTNQITVTWTTAGSQWVRVTYTGANGCDATTYTQYNVTVNSLPVPVISGPTTSCPGTTGNVYSTQAGMTNYIWTYSSGGTATSGGGTGDNSVTITWNTTGAQWVRLIYTDANGCTNASATQLDVTVGAPILIGPEEPCLGSTNNVYSTDVGNTNYDWNVSVGGTITAGGSSSSSTVTVTWTGLGAQTVSVNYTSAAGCEASTPTVLNVDVKSLPTPSITGSNSVCTGATGVVYTTESGKSSYAWSVPTGGTITSGGTSSSNTATVTWNTAGTHSVLVNYEDNFGCSAETPTSYGVTVKPLPSPSVTGNTSVCVGTTGLTYTTETGMSDYIWTIQGGSITAGQGTNQITVTWSSAGAQWVSVNYTDDGCYAANATQYAVTVLPLPVPGITGSASVCINAANVEYTTEAGMTNYQWTVSSGGSIVGLSTNSNVFITWNTVGSQTVSVTYTGTNGCDASAPTVYNVTVNPLPTPSITGSNEVCNNSTGNIYTTQPGMTNYDWVVSGGSITAGGSSSDNTVTITWNTTGTQSVSVNYSQTGCPAVAPYTYNVTVNPLPVADAGTNQSIPNGTSTVLSGTATGGTPTLTYQWTPVNMIASGGTTLGPTTENIYATQTFVLTVTDSKLCTDDDAMDVIVIGDALSVDATATPNPICNDGTTVQLNATASGGNSAVQQDFSWTSTPAGFTSTDQNPIVNPTQSTTYHVSVYDGFNTATNSVVVIVNPLPTIFTVSGGGEYCSGGSGRSVTLNGSQSGVDYQLLLGGSNFGSPIPGTGAGISFNNLTTAGVYTIHATNSSTGCEQDMSGSATISVNQSPTAFAGTDQTIFHGTSTSLAGAASPGTLPMTYLWTPTAMIASGATTLAPNTVNLYATQLFDLTVTDSKGCTDTDQVQVTVDGTALAVVADVNPSPICEGSFAQLSATGTGGSGTYTYSWDAIPGTWTSTEQNPIVSPSVTTLYTVTIDDGYNTATSSIALTVNPTPISYSVVGGGSYCSGGTGVTVGLSNSEIGVSYQLYNNGNPTGSPLTGTGNAISFGFQTVAGNYTVGATRILTNCQNTMSGMVSVVINPLPDAYTMTGGGSYPQGGIGVIVGLSDSQLGVNYRLINNSDTLTPAPGIAGTGSSINFGYQTLAGTYTAFGTNAVTGCVTDMLNTSVVTINPYPGIFNIYGGDTICADGGTEIGLDGSEIGVVYALFRNNISILAGIPGIGDSLSFGTFSTAGTYTVIAENVSTGLQEDMAGSAVIVVEATPLMYSLSILQPGDNCLPVIPHLTGSQTSVVYQLNFEDINGFFTPSIETLTGTGSPLNFSSQTIPGTYTATAFLDHGHIICTTEMNGSIVADPSPAEFGMTPNGTTCEDTEPLCLLGSEPGINYQLWLNNQPIGVSIPGDPIGGPICFDTLAAPGVYSIHAINPATNCEIFFTEQITVYQQPIRYVMSPDVACSGSEIILNDCEAGMEYYLYFDPASREFIELAGPISCTNGVINFGPQYDEGIYYIKAVDPVTNCFVWMYGSTTIYPNPEIFEISPQSGGCAPLEIYLEDFELDATYFLYRGTELVATDDGLDGAVNFGAQTLTGVYTVKARLNHPGNLYCFSDMNGSVEIFEALNIFTLLPQNPGCATTTFHLTGSQSGISYELWNDVSGLQETVMGTGNIISFSPQSEPGQYWVVASSGDNCDAQMNGIRTIYDQPSLYTMTPIGEWCSNDVFEIGVDSSDVGTTYQLHRDGYAGNPVVEVDGTGFPVILGTFTTEGTYHVKAVNQISGCERWMLGELIINLPPNIYSLTANGTTAQPIWYCPPVEIGLNNSQLGIEYTLTLPDNTEVTVIGTGSSIIFGSYSQVGSYSAIAFDVNTFCSVDMIGLVQIFEQPAVYDLSSLSSPPSFCFGDVDAISLMLSHSQTGLLYQLLKNGLAVGAPKIGDNNMIVWDSVSQYGPGTYSVEASFPVDPKCTSIMNGTVDVIELLLPTASISGYDSVCVNANCANMLVDITGDQLVELTYTDGTQDYVLEMDPVIQTHSVELCPTQNTTYQLVSVSYKNSPFCDGTVSGTYTIFVVPLPEAFAGNPSITCVTQPFTLSEATALNYSTVLWTIISGSGTLDDPSLLNPVYTPDLLDQGTVVTLEMTINGIGGCINDQDVSSIDITIDPLPIADAGPDQISCISAPSVQLADATAQYASSVLWQHNGAGSLSSANDLNPFYSPAIGDLGTSVTFILTAYGEGTCVGEEDQSSMTITFDSLPGANAGTGGTICESDIFVLSGSAQNYDSVLWQVIQGSGTFDDPTSLNATFSPGDVSSMTVMTLGLTVFGTGGCAAESSLSTVDITVYPAPEVYAGPNDTVCGLTSYSLSQATSTNALSYLWTSSGTGQFDNPNDLNPIYTPSQDDYLAGTVFLIIEGETTNAYCANSFDTIVLVLSEVPLADFTFNTPSCPKELIFFNDQSTTGSLPITQYEWDFGDGSNPIVILPPANPDTSYLYASGGTYTVSLIVINTNGCSDTSTSQITILPNIDKDFTISTGNSVCDDEPVIFTQTGSATLSSWLWDFGDGNTSTDLNPSHIYGASGSYTVVFSFTDTNNCSDSKSQQLQVFELPDISFNAMPNVTCSNSNIQFFGNSTSNIIAWLWDFGDGNNGSGQNPIHYYSIYGHIPVTLTVIDDNGCTNMMVDTVIVAEPLLVDFTYAFSCDTVTFTDLSVPPPGYFIVQWNWDFGDGSTVSYATWTEPAHIYGTGGVFDVTLTVVAESGTAQCTNSLTQSVSVPYDPAIYLLWYPQPTCLGDSTYFMGTSGNPITSWFWDFGDGNNSTLQGPSHLYDAIGDYEVTLYITDTTGCSNQLSDSVNIMDLPTASFTMANDYGCINVPVLFNGTSNAGQPSWLWDFGDGNFSTLQNPTHAYTSAGNFFISLTVTDTTACSFTTLEQMITINLAPEADFVATQLVCNSFAFVYTGDNGQAPTSFFWDFDDGGTSTLEDPTHAFPAGGLYNVKLVVSAAVSGQPSCADSITIGVVVPDGPNVGFNWNPEPTNYGDVTDFFGTSSKPIATWAWDFDDSGANSNLQDPSHTFSVPGIFDVLLTATDNEGCVGTSLHQVTVVDNPDVDFTFSPDPGCIDDEIIFTGISSGSIVSWDWDFGDGYILIGGNQIQGHTYNATGVYTVTLTVTDIYTGVNSVSKIVQVKPLPVANFSYEQPLCALFEVQFHDNSQTPVGYLTEWLWDFGDGNTTTVSYPNNPDVLHAYALPGTYDVTLVVMNSNSCIDDVVNQIVIIPSPTAAFSFSEGCLGQAIAFTDQSVTNGGNIISWNWNFGDPNSGSSNTSTANNPSHVFSASGDFDVTLIIGDINGCGDTLIQTITIADPPGVDFSFTTACLGLATQFTVDQTVTNVGEVQTFAWDFGDGNTSSSQDPEHTYAVLGTYQVTLTITTTAGCVNSITHPVQINPLPNANFEHDGPKCLGEPIAFTNLSSSPNGAIDTWVWDFGDGNTITITAPDNPNVEHTYANDVTYDVSLTVTDVEGCEQTVIKQVQVVASPIANFTFEETCFNEPVFFTDLSSTNGGADLGSWEWFFGDPNSGTNNNSTLQNPTHVFSEPGTFTVTLIVNSTLGCSDTIAQDVLVDPLPEVDFTMASDTICLGELAVFTGIGTDINTWFWQFGDGGTSIEQNPTYMYMAPGSYMVMLTVTGIDGCQNSVSYPIFVNQAPVGNFAHSGSCLGDSTYFSDLSVSENGYLVSWEWDFGDGGTASIEDPSHLYANNDSYLVTLIVTDNFGCSDTVQRWVNIFSLPTASFSFEQACEPVGIVYFFDASSPGEEGSPLVEYRWDFVDGYYSTEVNPNYIFPMTDTCYLVSLTVTDANGCAGVDTTEVCLFGELAVDFTATTVCLGQPTFFDASYTPASDSVAAYTWKFNDGSPQFVSFHDTTSHIFPNPGSYMVELSALDTNGCSFSIFKEVMVDSLPTPSFTYSAASCDQPTLFTDTSLGGGEFVEFWLWDFGDIASGTDNTSTLQHPAHVYAAQDSVYFVKLIVTNFNGCTDSVVQPVYRDPCISAEFILPSGALCATDELCFQDISVLTSNNGAVVLWEWDFGDGSTLSYDQFTDPVCHTYAAGGEYTVQMAITALVNGQMFYDTTLQQLTINPSPVAGFEVTAACFSDSTAFTDFSIDLGEPISTWEWDFGDLGNNDTSSSQHPKYVYQAAGGYTASLVVINDFGCSDTMLSDVRVFALPDAQFSFEDNCASYLTYFNSSLVSLEGDTTIFWWQWDFGDSLSTANNAFIADPSHIYSLPGTYNVSLLIMDENTCKDSITDMVEIFPIPTAGFVLTDDYEGRQGNISLENTSIGAQQYHWDFDNGDFSQEKDPIYQYRVDGNYLITLVVYNEHNCPDTATIVYELLFTNLYVPNAFAPGGPDEQLRSFKPVGINLAQYTIEIFSPWGNLVFSSSRLIDGAPAESWDGTFEGKEMVTGVYIWNIKARFKDDTYWKGSDIGDGNVDTRGTVTLIR